MHELKLAGGGPFSVRPSSSHACHGTVEAGTTSDFMLIFLAKPYDTVAVSNTYTDRTVLYGQSS